MSALIAVDGLVKRYATRVALDDVSLTVNDGEIVGLLGPNGAGKSTMLSVLATLLPFDAGAVTVAGHALPAAAAGARRTLGHVPQHAALYPTLSAHENLRFFARMTGLGGRAESDAVARVLVIVGLAERATEPVARLSGGMRRRLNLACGILHRPRVVLLDEPVVGVDPQSRECIFEAIVALAREGAAVLYSTHQMEEAERLACRVVLLDRGRVVAKGPPARVVADVGLTPRIRLRTARPPAEGWLAAVPGALVVDDAEGSLAVAVTGAAAVPAVLAAAARAGGEVVELTFVQPTLADAFFALTGRALRDDDGAEVASV